MIKILDVKLNRYCVRRIRGKVNCSPPFFILVLISTSFMGLEKTTIGPSGHDSRSRHFTALAGPGSGWHIPISFIEPELSKEIAEILCVFLFQFPYHTTLNTNAV